jgi:hypothetical protein
MSKKGVKHVLISIPTMIIMKNEISAFYNEQKVGYRKG